MAKLKYRIPIVKCKSPGCDTDLDYTGAGATGLGALPPFAPNRPYKILIKDIMHDPGKLVCPECNQAHEYTRQDIVEGQVLEPEVGDVVLALGQNGRFELMSVTGGIATIKLLAEGVQGPIDIDYTIQVPSSVLTVFRAKSNQPAA